MRPTPWKINPAYVAAGKVPHCDIPPTPAEVPLPKCVVSYTEWTREEEKALLEAMMGPRSGGHRQLYAKITTRSRAAIRGKLQRMGLVSPRPRKPAFTP